MGNPEIRKLRRGTWANALGYLAVLLVVSGGLYYIDQRDAERSRQICGLITLLDVPLPSPTVTPVPTPGPALERQQKILREMHAFHQGLGCPAATR